MSIEEKVEQLRKTVEESQFFDDSYFDRGALWVIGNIEQFLESQKNTDKQHNKL